MSGKDDKPLDPHDLDSKVLEWLQTQGHPFELRVAELFRRLGWEVGHARAYSDPATAKTRQIDLVATVHRSEREDSAGATVTLVVECKKSSEPWVIFTAEGDPDYGGMEPLAAADELTRDLIWQLMGENQMKSELLSRVRSLGHGVVRVIFKKAGSDKKTDPELQPYTALQEVLSAATALGAQNKQDLLHDQDFQPALELVFPVVVLDAPLYTFERTRDGQERLSRCDSAKVHVPRANDYGVTIPVMTFNGLERVLISDTPIFEDMCRWLSRNNVVVRQELLGGPELGDSDE